MTEKEELLEQIQSIFAEDALNEQNVREARKCVDKILEMNPKNGEAYYYQLLLDYGVVMLVSGIFFFVGSLQYDGAYRKAKVLEETYITPFEDKTRKELEEYCRTNLQGHGNVELKGVKHYCQRY